jgi:hypothetical protein
MFRFWDKRLQTPLKQTRFDFRLLHWRLQALCWLGAMLYRASPKSEVDITQSNEYWFHPPNSAGLGLWTAAGATEPFSRRGDCGKERVIVPGRRRNWVMAVRRTGFPTLPLASRSFFLP